VKIEGDLGGDINCDFKGWTKELTLDLKVCAANNLAAGGASGERRRRLQVDHASG